MAFIQRILQTILSVIPAPIKKNWWIILVVMFAVAGITLVVLALTSRARKKKFDAIIAPTGSIHTPTNTDSRGTVRTDMSQIIGQPAAAPQPEPAPQPVPEPAPTYASNSQTRTANDDRTWEPDATPQLAYEPKHQAQPSPSQPARTSPGVARTYSALSNLDASRQQPAPESAAAPEPAPVPTGTVRMTSPTPETVSATGTVRFADENIGKEIHITERRDRDGYEQEHLLYLDKQLDIGRVPPNDLVVNDQFVSSRHLTIRRETDGLYIADMNSANGTRVNGERLSGIQPLRSGDIAVIGVTSLKITFEE